MKPVEERIAELDRELAALREERERLASEARGWAEKRDSIHERIRGLRAEVAGLRERRDALNRAVQELKGLRDEAYARRRERRNQASEVREGLRALMERAPSRSMDDLEREIEGLEWRIQTSSLTLGEEKALVDRVRPLEAQLQVHRQIQSLRNRLAGLQKEGEDLGAEAKLHHERLTGLAEQGQAFHERMLETLGRISGLQEEADGDHQRYVAAGKEAQALRGREAELARQIALLREELRQAEEKRREERAQALRRELEERALEKRRRGEKLTLEEFKVLAEGGNV